MNLSIGVLASVGLDIECSGCEWDDLDDLDDLKLKKERFVLMVRASTLTVSMSATAGTGGNGGGNSKTDASADRVPGGACGEDELRWRRVKDILGGESMVPARTKIKVVWRTNGVFSS